MDHSTAILEDAAGAIDAAAPPSPPAAATSSDVQNANNHLQDQDHRQNNYNRRKRKADFAEPSMHHGSRGGRGGGRGDNKRNKKGDMGRAEYLREGADKRKKTDESREKRNQGKGPDYGTKFTEAEIEAEERKPKRKVAVFIGYSGTGYKGMQISASEKTIEGDLFKAFIAAGAISKANADDPKKASLVRCARTDKGVHAAGNMISLKLIIEDKDIVAKINENLSPQIRIWGIERTIGSFSCYQACDSRWYEYLIPSHAFLPPHPSSWLATKLEKAADDAGDRAAYEDRQKEVKDFWKHVDLVDIQSVVETIDEDIRHDVVKALQGEEEAYAKDVKQDADVEQPIKAGSSLSGAIEEPEIKEDKTEEAAIIINEPSLIGSTEPASDFPAKDEAVKDEAVKDEAVKDEDGVETVKVEAPSSDANNATDQAATTQLAPEEFDRHMRIRAATKQLRNAYSRARRQYRITTQRLEQIQAALDQFVGTKNYHNYTVSKTFHDPSAQRVIKSFKVNTTPILIGDSVDIEKSEWLSLKVHGQSFMMHQIRKMIGMVALLVRCGANLKTLNHSFGEERYPIPKVPGLGLLLERPVFDSYNDRTAVKHEREKLEFSKFEKEIEEFKQREIYQRIFREEEEKNEFTKFFNHVDNFREPHFLYVTSLGLEVTKVGEKQRAMFDAGGSDEEGQSDG